MFGQLGNDCVFIETESIVNYILFACVCVDKSMCVWVIVCIWMHVYLLILSYCNNVYDNDVRLQCGAGRTCIPLLRSPAVL